MRDTLKARGFKEVKVAKWNLGKQDALERRKIEDKEGDRSR